MNARGKLILKVNSVVELKLMGWQPLLFCKLAHVYVDITEIMSKISVNKQKLQWDFYFPTLSIQRFSSSNNVFYEMFSAWDGWLQFPLEWS